MLGRALAAAALLSAGAAEAQTTIKTMQPWLSQGRLASSVVVTSASAATQLPNAGGSLLGNVAWICNAGGVDAYLNFGALSVTVTASAGSWLRAGTCGSYDLRPFGSVLAYVAAVTASGTTGLLVETGTGVPPPNLTVGFDSGAVSATQTPANASHTAGQAVGNLFSIPVARSAGGSGRIDSVNGKSVGGITAQLVVRMWQKNPTSTTCTDNANFVGSDTDDANLVTPPFAVTPAAPTVTTGDAATYWSLIGQALSYRNVDATPSQNIYVCVVTATTFTPTASALRITGSGPQN